MDAVIYFILGTAEHAFILYLTPGLPYIQLHTCTWPPPALVTQLTEPSVSLSLLWLLLQDYVAKQEYPVVGH